MKSIALIILFFCFSGCCQTSVDLRIEDSVVVSNAKIGVSTYIESVIYFSNYKDSTIQVVDLNTGLQTTIAKDSGAITHFQIWDDTLIYLCRLAYHNVKAVKVILSEKKIKTVCKHLITIIPSRVELIDWGNLVFISEKVFTIKTLFSDSIVSHKNYSGLTLNSAFTQDFTTAQSWAITASNKNSCKIVSYSNGEFDEKSIGQPLNSIKYNSYSQIYPRSPKIFIHIRQFDSAVSLLYDMDINKRQSLRMLGRLTYDFPSSPVMHYADQYRALFHADSTFYIVFLNKVTRKKISEAPRIAW